MTTGDLFGAPTVDDVSLEDQLACVERELAMRRQAYPRWVASDRMSPEQAGRELLCMEAVLATLQRLVAGGGGITHVR